MRHRESAARAHLDNRGRLEPKYKHLYQEAKRHLPRSEKELHRAGQGAPLIQEIQDALETLATEWKGKRSGRKSGRDVAPVMIVAAVAPLSVLFYGLPARGLSMKAEKTKPDEILRRLREELGGIRSCALMMVHAQAKEVRSRYLKTLNEKIDSIDQLLAKLYRDE